ncbi:MAG: hypothetical protein ABIP95_07055 [Pelobium sp.]
MENTKNFDHPLLFNKTVYSLELYDCFISAFKKIGVIELVPKKTMIALTNGEQNIVWITALGKDFLHVVFPFPIAYTANLCFQKIAQVPGDANQFNHHFRMLFKEDINEEVLGFMKLAYHME